MKISKTMFLLGILCTAFIACKKSDVPTTGTETPPPVTTLSTGTSGPSPGNFSSDRAYNLNVIYFVPADVNPVVNYQKRLSDLLLWGQNWYKEQMTLNGYPNKTFGLFTDAAKKNVRLIIIQGTKSKSEYKYDGGSGNIVTEVNAFFTANPTLKTGDHNLIIVPAYFMKTDGTPGGGAFGPPFYGIGKTCFALDYEEMDLKHLGASGILGDAFSVWFGGLMHELGHGLNLPHNCQKVSENTDPLKGMALMWGGNGTLGKSPTFLTAADAAVLNVNQVFNTDTRTYYAAVNSAITGVHADYVPAKGAIVVSGRFSTDGQVTSVLYYNDPNVNNEGTGTNKDYNATTWESKTIGTDSFYVEMPISELKYKIDGMVYELKVKLVNDNGNVKETVYPYVFNAGIPVIDFGQKASQYNRSNWSILNFSSNQTSGDDGKASNIIDGSFNSSWISRWSSPAAVHPHYVAIDMKAPLQITGFTIAMESRYETKSKDIELLTSTDGTNWSTAGNYVLKQIAGPQHVYLSAARNARYVKLVVNSAWNGTGAANIAEIATFNE